MNHIWAKSHRFWSNSAPPFIHSRYRPWLLLEWITLGILPQMQQTPLLDMHDVRLCVIMYMCICVWSCACVHMCVSACMCVYACMTLYVHDVRLCACMCMMSYVCACICLRTLTFHCTGSTYYCSRLWWSQPLTAQDRDVILYTQQRKVYYASSSI